MTRIEELRRRAYGPPLSEADARAAQVELRLLAEGERMPDRPLPRLEPVASSPRRGMLLLAAACLGAAALATGTLLAPLGSLGPWNAFAFLTEEGNVCVSAFLGRTSGGGSCTSRETFEAQGISFGTSLAGEDLRVTWGPTGGARLEGRPR